jgi:P27 family predicted phage terminase small subunit
MTRRTPSHLKIITGNPGKRPLPVNEPKPKRARPSAPAHLSDRAKAAWPSLVDVLDNTGVLTVADALALEMLAESVADFLEARATLKAFGSNFYETKTPTGATMHRAHPALAAMQAADKRARAWMVEFGMTPSARTKVQKAPSEEIDPASRYFAS